MHMCFSKGHIHMLTSKARMSFSQQSSLVVTDGLTALWREELIHAHCLLCLARIIFYGAATKSSHFNCCFNFFLAAQSPEGMTFMQIRALSRNGWRSRGVKWLS